MATPLYQTIVDRVPAPNVDLEGTLQMQISSSTTTTSLA